MLQAVTEDLDPNRNGFNTAIARMTEFVNTIYKLKANISETEVVKHVLVNFIKVLAPFVPHLAEELWFNYVLAKEVDKSSYLKDSVHKQSWIKFKPEYMESNVVNLVLQIKGKKIDVVEISKDLSKEDLEKLAFANVKMQKRLEGLNIKQVIVVPNKLVNVVAI
jgi:leucyl-tRNA synthetase